MQHAFSRIETLCMARNGLGGRGETHAPAGVHCCFSGENPGFLMVVLGPRRQRAYARRRLCCWSPSNEEISYSGYPYSREPRAKPKLCCKENRPCTSRIARVRRGPTSEKEGILRTRPSRVFVGGTKSSGCDPPLLLYFCRIVIASSAVSSENLGSTLIFASCAIHRPLSSLQIVVTSSEPI